ncbi:MAG TPA: DinB family protein [Actinomycetota bacterium]|nr:DinB family protein [Actinomycetota bacterium]
MTEPPRPTDKGTILARERDGWAAWWVHVEGVDPDATRPDGWSLKDVIAHIAAWQRYSAERLAALGRGEPDPGPPAAEDDFNAVAREVSLSRSWEEVRTEAERAHHEFVATIEAVPENMFAMDEGLGAFVVAVNGVEHYEEHVPDVFHGS